MRTLRVRRGNSLCAILLGVRGLLFWPSIRSIIHLGYCPGEMAVCLIWPFGWDVHSPLPGAICIGRRRGPEGLEQERRRGPDPTGGSCVLSCRSLSLSLSLSVLFCKMRVGMRILISPCSQSSFQGNLSVSFKAKEIEVMIRLKPAETPQTFKGHWTFF